MDFLPHFIRKLPRIQWGLKAKPSSRTLRDQQTLTMKNFLLLSLLLTASSISAQVITVIRDGQSHFHYGVGQLADLVNTTSPDHTLPGDTIILPGGSILTPNFTISKQLTFIGAGILNNGTHVTGPTVLTSSSSTPTSPVFSFTNGSAGSSFHGIIFNSLLRFLGFGNNASDYSMAFTKCQFNQRIDLSIFPGNGTIPPAPSNVIIKNCVIFGGIDNYSTSAGIYGLQVYNSFIAGSIRITNTTPASNSIISQSIITGASSHNSNPGIIFSNNIFVKNSGTYNFSSSSASYFNNLFGTDSNSPLPSLGSGATNGNMATQNSMIFENVTDFNAFSESFNYHPSAGSPAIGMGQGAYDVGVYGGAPGNPWKEHALPFNPHWDELLPPGNFGTTSGGIINVTIQGSAQTH